MTYKANNAVYALNSYVWKLLQANLGWTTSGQPPIKPTQQQPEMMQAGTAFLVYGSSNQNPGHNYALRKESVVYTIYAPSSTEANNVVNLLVEAFERQDEAAADVNQHLHLEGKNRGVSFGSVEATGSIHAEPADEEGGFVEGLVMLEIIYTVQSTAQTTGFTYP